MKLFICYIIKQYAKIENGKYICNSFDTRKCIFILSNYMASG